MTSIVCQQCGREVVRRGPTQKYCENCSTHWDTIRKRLWARAHPPSPVQAVRNHQHSKRCTELARQAGINTNRTTKSSIAWIQPDVPDLIWLVRVVVPFTYAASKNHIYTLRRSGHVALRREARAKRVEIAARIRLALRGRRVAHNKLWIDILVQKPDHRGDAVNVIDLVCDAIKDAVPVDDRWFCIRRLDWEIAKEEPRLYIGLGQDSEVDAQVCSYCGQIKPLTDFNKSKHNPLGAGRECKECRRLGRLLRKQRLQREGGSDGQ